MALLFVVLGVVFAVLNQQAVHVDLWFRTFDTHLGLILLMVLLLGALLGGLVVTVSIVWPLRRRLHQSGEIGSGPDRQELVSEKDA